MNICTTFQAPKLHNASETIQCFMVLLLIQLFLFRLGEDYQQIADKALTQPASTSELMALIEYVRVVECQTVFEMEDRLKEVMSYILFLSDYTIISAIEMKQNSLTFQWYNKMASVLEENRRIVEEKTLEYQQSLKVSVFVPLVKIMTVHTLLSMTFIHTAELYCFIVLF